MRGWKNTVKYRTRPFEIHAVQFTGNNWGKLEAFCGTRPSGYNQKVRIPNFVKAGTYNTYESDEIEAEVYVRRYGTWFGVRKMDYIVMDDNREFYAVTPEKFESRYEPIGIQPDNYQHQKIYITGGPWNGRVIEPTRHAGAVVIEDGIMYERTDRFHLGYHVYVYAGAVNGT